MTWSVRVIGATSSVGLALVLCQSASAQEQPFRFAGTTCATPPALHCPDQSCPSDRVINQGPVVEMKTRRTYFLDYPCDLKPGEQVTFILSLHGGGSYGNWQRHYFPIMDYKEKHRLVIATPNAPTRAWSAADDEYLQNIVEFVVSQIGRERIKAFWLAGHSQGGMTSNRLIRTDYFKDKVDGWLSLSGGRLGGSPGRAGSFGPPPGAGAAAARPAGPGPEFAAAAAALSELPAADFSFIYETGQREVDDKGVPAASAWAAKYGCGARGAPRRSSTPKPVRLRRQPAESAESCVGTAPRSWQGPRARIWRVQRRKGGRRRGSTGQGPHRGTRTADHRRARDTDALGEGRQTAAGSIAILGPGPSQNLRGS